MHSCPECGSACYCGGDVDDCEVGDEEAEENCTHCAEGDGDEDDEEWYDEEEDEEDEEEDG